MNICLAPTSPIELSSPQAPPYLFQFPMTFSVHTAYRYQNDMVFPGHRKIVIVLVDNRRAMKYMRGSD